MIWTPPTLASGLKWDRGEGGRGLGMGPQIRRQLCLNGTQARGSFSSWKPLEVWKNALADHQQETTEEVTFRSWTQSWGSFGNGLFLRACPRGSCYWLCYESPPGSFPAARSEHVSWTFEQTRRAHVTLLAESKLWPPSSTPTGIYNLHGLVILSNHRCIFDKSSVFTDHGSALHDTFDDAATGVLREHRGKCPACSIVVQQTKSQPTTVHTPGHQVRLEIYLL